MRFFSKVVLIGLFASFFFNDCGHAGVVSTSEKVKESAIIKLNGSSVSIDHVIIIDMEISTRTMRPVLRHIDKLISDNDSSTIKDLYLILNSPGGSVGTGFQFINKMKTLKGRGTKITCFVPDLAASMAFGIFVHCDQRFVLSESELLWHRARTMFGNQPMTGPDLIAVGEQLRELDGHILQDLNESSIGKTMSRERILYHFNHETFHLGKNLCSVKAPAFCQSKNWIPGLMEALNNDEITRTEQPQLSLQDPFGFFPGELIYIQPDFMIKRMRKEVLKQ